MPLRRKAVERLPVRLHEAKRTIVQHLNGDAALVHEAVVAPAEQDEVRGFRLTALPPVLHMMGIDEARVRAPRKAAAAIARLNARRSAGGMLRVRRPTLSGSPALSSSR